MTRTNHLKIWAVVLAVFFLMLWALGNMLAPFIIALVIAYLLDPVVERLSRCRIGRWTMPRGIASAMVLGFFIFTVVLAIMLALPLIQDQVAGLVQAIPAYTLVAKEKFTPRIAEFLTHLSPDDATRLREAAGNYAGSAVTWLAEIIQRMVKSGAAIANILSIVAITPIVAFYMMRDWQAITGRIDDLLPCQQADTIRGLLRQMDQSIAGFVRGQSLVCLFLGGFYALGLSVVGLNFGFVIGAIAGFLSFVPYVGTIFGIISSLCLAFFQFDTASQILPILGVFTIGQVLEGYVLTPKLVGESIGLNAVWVIFALMAGASLFGFVGLLVAVPVAAILAVLIRFFILRYKDSPLYDDRKTTPARL